MWYMCTCLRLQMPVLVGVCSSRGRRKAQGSPSVSLHLPLRQYLSLNLKLGWQPASPAILLSSPTMALGLLAGILSHAWLSIFKLECQRFEFKFSCLHSEHCYSLSYPSRPMVYSLQVWKCVFQIKNLQTVP